MTPTPSLKDLDPARHDPGYWHRLHRRIIDTAGPELARRRRMNASVPVLVLEWSRTVVPAALLAATVAGLLLLRGAPEAPSPDRFAVAPEISVDELIEERGGDFMEAAVGAPETSADGGIVWFAGGGF